MKKIIWRNLMSVDGGIIDEDHKILIDYINEFLSMSNYYNHCSEDFRQCDELATPPCGQEISCNKKNFEILSLLKFYTHSHFKREEELQIKIGFPQQNCQHKSLIAKLDNMIEKLEKSNDSSEDFKKTLIGLGSFFNTWLIEHILTEDLKMKPYIQMSKAKSVRYLNLK